MPKIRKNPNEISRDVSSGALSYNKAEARRTKKTSTRPLIVLGVIGFAVSIYSYSHFIIFSNDCQRLGKSDTPPKKALVIAKNSNKENTMVYTLDGPYEVSRVVSSGAHSYNKAEARRRKKTSTRPLIVLGVIGNRSLGK